MIMTSFTASIDRYVMMMEIAEVEDDNDDDEDINDDDSDDDDDDSDDDDYEDDLYLAF